ncbi:hypothetical protein D3C72_1920000 [compost metagenome]
MLYTAPLGLPGPLRISQRVRSPMCCSTWCAVSLQPCARPHSINTGSPPLKRTLSGNDGQYGAGTSTSSPSSRVAAKALKMICLAPLAITMEGSE